VGDYGLAYGETEELLVNGSRFLLCSKHGLHGPVLRIADGLLAVRLSAFLALARALPLSGKEATVKVNAL
jgi:hypothetical protein